jgi:flagellar basal-body rod modification protein FlgD
MITPSASSSSVPQNLSVERAETTMNETFDDFLTLLTTQLKNQDPISPMDTTEFTNQLVSFSQVEQQIGTNTRLDQLLEAQSGGQFGEAIDFIGREVEIVGNRFRFDGEPVTFGYGTPADANVVTVQLLDSVGRTVWTQRGDTGFGRHEVEWDGTMLDGTPAPEGRYTIRVTARNAEGEDLEVGTFSRGVVTGAESADGQTTLLLGDVPVAVEDVLAVRSPAP